LRPRSGLKDYISGWGGLELAFSDQISYISQTVRLLKVITTTEHE